MFYDIPVKTIVDPSDPRYSNWIFPLFQSHTYIRHFEPVKVIDPSTEQEEILIFTHPIFLLQKPERKSRKTQQTKPQGNYFQVINPTAIGDGNYGDVYPVLGVWKLFQDHCSYKVKPSPETLRLVKTSGLFADSAPDEDITRSFNREYRIGSWVPHMGINYAPVVHDNSIFLLMRRQPGITLKSLIKALQINPDVILTGDQLTIIINLLTEYHNQISSLKFPIPKTQTIEQLVHCDIKPENILVSHDLKVYYIDFGLAALSNNKFLRGTPMFMDPKFIAEQKVGNDEVTDMSSLARVIATLLGDISSNKLVTKKNLHNRNVANTMVGLLSNIKGLSPDLKSSLTTLVKSMTAYEEKERISREDALKRFIEIRTIYLNDESSYINKLLNENNLAHLTSDEAFFILRTNRAKEFLDKHSNQPDALKALLNPIGLRVLDLDLSILHLIKDRYVQFGHEHTMLCVLTKDNVTPKQVSTLLELGATVNEACIKYWMEEASDVDNELQWSQICRLLHQAYPEFNRLIRELQFSSQFKFYFCLMLLKAIPASVDQDSNVHILLQHIDTKITHLISFRAIKKALQQHFANTAFANSLVQHIESWLEKTTLQLIEEPIFYEVGITLKEFNLSSTGLLDVLPHAYTPIRNSQLEAAQKEILAIRTLTDNQLEEAFKRIKNLTTTLSNLNKLELIYKKLAKDIPQDFISTFMPLLDRYYRQELLISNETIKDADSLCQAFKLFKKIEQKKANLLAAGYIYANDPLLEKNYLGFIATLDFENAHALIWSLEQFHDLYASLGRYISLVISANKKHIPSTINQIKFYLEALVPEDDVPFILRSIRTHVEKCAQSQPPAEKPPSIYSSLKSICSNFFKPAVPVQNKDTVKNLLPPPQIH